jgi:drug/metabolite transporter (DMT)-like permease
MTTDLHGTLPGSSIARIGQLGLLGLLSVLWGSSYAFIRIGVETIPPVTLIAVRTLIAGSLLLAVLHVRNVTLPRGGAIWRAFAVQALLNSAIPFTLIAWAERTVESGLATILNSTSPVFVFLLALVLARRDEVTPAKLTGAAAGLGGVVLIIGTEALTGLGRDLVAQLAIVAATLCYAGAAIWGRRFGGLDPMVPAAGSLICGALILMPLSMVFDQPWTLRPSPRSLMALGGLALFSTALAFVIYFRLLRMLGPVGTTAQAYLRVPVGVAIGVGLLGEVLAPTAWFGLALVVIGVAAMTLDPSIVVPSWLRALAARARRWSPS